MVCCILCGVNNESKRIRKPDSFPETPSRVLCPNCGFQSECEYRVEYSRFCVCLVPCCCKCNDSEPYIACSNCTRPLGIISGNKCNKCNLVTTFNSQNCPECGERK